MAADLAILDCQLRLGALGLWSQSRALTVAPLAFGHGHCSEVLLAVMTFHRLGGRSESE